MAGSPNLIHAPAAEPIAAAPKYFIVFVGALIALGPLSLDAYLPAMPMMAEAFGVGMVQLNSTISTYLVGYGFGQFFGGAFSDQIGRKRIGVIGLAVFIGASLAIASADTIGQVQWLRLVQAIGGGFSTVICMAAIRDVYPIDQLGRRFATVTMIMLLAPLLAPGVGAFLLRFGWQSIFVAKAVYAGVLLLVYVVAIPETHAGRWSHLSVSSTLRQCAAVVCRRVDGRLLPMRYVLAMSLSAGVFMTFLTNASFLYIEYFGVTPAEFPIFFGMNVLGMMSANFLSMKRLRADNADKYFRRGLAVQAVGAACLLLIVLAGVASLATVVPALVLVISTLGVVGPAGSARYMGFFQKLSGSASAAYTTLMFSGGAALGVLTGVFFDGTLLPVVAVMMAASLAANVVACSIPHEPAVAVPVEEHSAA